MEVRNLHKVIQIFLTSAFLSASFAASAAAQCNSIPIAVDDPVDYFGRPISVEPMLNDREPDGEALHLTVTSHDCDHPETGLPVSVVVDNGTVRLVPSQPGAPAVCTINYQIEDENGFTAGARMLVKMIPFFEDGFETGNTTRWKQTITSGGGVEP